MSKDKIVQAIRDGLGNHTGEWFNTWATTVNLTNEQEVKLLADILSNERLLKNLDQLIQDECKEAYKKGYSDGYIESHNLQMNITKQLTKGDTE